MFLIDKANTPSVIGASLYYLVKKRVKARSPKLVGGMEKPGAMNARLHVRIKGSEPDGSYRVRRL